MRVVVLVILIVCAAVICVIHWEYPYGNRIAFNRMVISYLIQYAGDHNGWLPKDGKTPLESLQLLYSEYTKDGECLAGASGNISAVKVRLKAKLAIDDTISSWIYFPGFNAADDHRIAVIWERKKGITGEGRRSPIGGHSVGFLDGTSEQIGDREWPGFLRRQEEMRNNVVSNRSKLFNGNDRVLRKQNVTGN